MTVRYHELFDTNLVLYSKLILPGGGGIFSEDEIVPKEFVWGGVVFSVGRTFHEGVSLEGWNFSKRLCQIYRRYLKNDQQLNRKDFFSTETTLSVETQNKQKLIHMWRGYPLRNTELFMLNLTICPNFLKKRLLTNKGHLIRIIFF